MVLVVYGLRFLPSTKCSKRTAFESRLRQSPFFFFFFLNLLSIELLIFFNNRIFIGSFSYNFLFLILSLPNIFSYFSFISCFSCFFYPLLTTLSRRCLFFRSYRSSTFAFRLSNSFSLIVGPCPFSSLLSLLAASSRTHCNSSLSYPAYTRVEAIICLSFPQVL